MSEKKSLSELARGFRKRTLVTARLATKTGFKLLAKTLSPAGKPTQIDEAKSIDAALQLVETMGEMKGLIMKFGQMASYLEGSMPPAAQRVLAQLQAHSTPMTFEAVSAVLAADLGASADDLFDGFEREPFAAASLGQVHRAALEGTAVAVKVQYPGVAELLNSDLRTVGAFARLGTLLSPIDGGALIRELQQRMNEECDYVAEAANQRLFRHLLHAIKGAQVPRVCNERSTKRVLTSALSRARPFEQFCREASQEEKNRAAVIIWTTCFTCIYQHCVFNADPHPGNYLFDRQGQVVFLDFGCVKRWSAVYVETWKRLARSILDEDRETFKQTTIDSGYVGRERGFDWDYQWQAMRYIYKPLTEPNFIFNSDYVKSSYSMLMFDNPNIFRSKIPPDVLFVNRLQWGLYSVLSSLNAQADWGTIFRRILAAPTVPAPDTMPPCR